MLIHPSFHAKIQYFLTVAETLNFGRAAERLGIAQPALSRSIRQLEQQFGFALFERSTRRVALTPAGEVLYRDGADAMKRLATACARAGQVGRLGPCADRQGRDDGRPQGSEHRFSPPVRPALQPRSRGRYRRRATLS